MTIAGSYNFLTYIANKEQSGAKINSVEFNMLAEAAQWKFMKRKFSIPEEYQIGMPFSRQMYEITQSIIDSMQKFKVIMGNSFSPMLPVASNGTAVLPSDYLHISSIGYDKITTNGITTTPKRVSIEPLTDAEWNDRLGSDIKAPSDKYPICQVANGLIHFMPKNINLVHFTYLRKPVTPVCNFTTDPATEIEIPNTTGNTEFEFTGSDVIDITSIMLEMIGVNIESQALTQMANKFIKEG